MFYSEDEGHTEGFSNRNGVVIPFCVLALPLSTHCPAAVLTLTAHTHCVREPHLNQWRDFAPVLPPPHHRAKNNRLYGELVNDMDVGFCLFSFFWRECPWGRFSVKTIPVSKNRSLPRFVSGACVAAVHHSVLCLSMGALWGGGGVVAVMMRVDQF